MTSDRRTTPVQEAVVVGLFALVVFLVTRTRDVGLDDCLFAMSVDSFLLGKDLWWGFVHPHHPLLNPLVALVVSVGHTAFPGWLTLDAGAAVSAVFGAAAVGGVVWMLRRSGWGAASAMLGGALLMATAGFWGYATRMEVYTMTAAAILCWLWAVARPEPRSTATGLALAGAVLCHVAAGVLVLPSLWRFRSRPRDLAKVLALGVGAPLASLYVVLAALHGAWSPRAWLAIVAPGGTVEKWVDPGGASVLVGVFRSLLVSDWYRRVPILDHGAVSALNGLAIAASVIGAVLLASGVATGLRRDRPLPSLALGACVAYVPIWLLWDVGNVEHAVAVAPLLAILIVAGADRFGPRLAVASVGTLSVLLVLVNGVGSAVPQSRPENSWSWVVASFVLESTPENAVILTAGTSPRFRVSVPYLSERRFVDLALLRSRLGAGQPPEAALEAWYRKATAESNVWVHPDVFSAEGRAFVQTLDIPVASWDRVIASFRPQGSVSCAADGAVLQSPFTLTRVETRAGGP